MQVALLGNQKQVEEGKLAYWHKDKVTVSGAPP